MIYVSWSSFVPYRCQNLFLRHIQKSFYMQISKLVQNINVILWIVVISCKICDGAVPTVPAWTGWQVWVLITTRCLGCNTPVPVAPAEGWGPLATNWGPSDLYFYISILLATHTKLMGKTIRIWVWCKHVGSDKEYPKFVKQEKKITLN